MASKSFIASLVSIFILYLFALISIYFIDRRMPNGGEIITIVFWVTVFILPVLFIILCALNLFLQWRIKSAKRYGPDSVYFLYSLLLTFLTIFSFVLFDYSDRGRYFEEKTFLDILTDYWRFFILAILIILVNRKIVWNNFKDTGSIP
jgi:hypothetical protein